MSSSNNINYADLHYVKKRKLRSQVDDQAPSTSTGNAGAGGASASGNSNLNDKNGLFTFSISLRFFISEFDYKKKNPAVSCWRGRNSWSEIWHLFCYFLFSRVFFIFILGGQQNKTSSTSATNEPLNDIEKYLSIRKQVEQRRKNLFPVFLSKPPQGFKDYLMNRKTYLLQGNERCR